MRADGKSNKTQVILQTDPIFPPACSYSIDMTPSHMLSQIIKPSG